MERSEAGPCEISVPFLVALRAIAAVVRFAVYLDCETGFETREIEAIWAERVLAAEFEAGRARAEDTPEDYFGWVAAAAFLAGAEDRGAASG